MTESIEILNLYAGIGGNCALWPTEVNGTPIHVTAVEHDPDIAAAYSELWPNDTVFVGDAHEYLLEHLFDGWDFIWSSPPCQTHSRLNMFARGKQIVRYPHLDQLYGEILLLKHMAPNGTKWLVENVIPYYEYLVKVDAILDRHSAWCGGFISPQITLNRVGKRVTTGSRGYKKSRGPHELWSANKFQEELGIFLPTSTDKWEQSKKLQVMRNCVDPRIGLAVFNAALTCVNEHQDTLLEVQV